MNLFLAKSFLKYYWRAKTIYNTDSTFLLNFYQEVWHDDRQYYAFTEGEQYRRALLQSGETIEVLDLGAGSQHLGQQRQRLVKNIANTALSPRWVCELLFRLILWQKPKTKIELGTSLGLSTLYQHLPNRRSSQFFSLEGCPQTAALAGRKLKLYAPHVQQIIGDFADTLPQTLQQIEKLDYAFIDGNHRYQPTMQYFEQCLQKSHAGTILVFDDIYWSPEMQKAWQEICARPEVQLTIDLFRIGLVFIRPTNGPKQNLTLIPFRYKPWRIGIFR